MECIGAMRFAKVRLAPGEKKEYIICAGITEKENFNKEFEKYNSKEKVEAAWKQNEEHWNGEADKIKFQGNSDKFDGWLRWVSIQPVLRKYMVVHFFHIMIMEEVVAGGEICGRII